jgi:RND family efflux transporter MFP subunit
MRLPKSCFKLGGLLLVAGIVITVGCDEKHPEPVKTPPPIVEVARPLARQVTDYQIFTARTQAVDSVEVKARVTGYLMKLDFKDGDEVKAGQVLFEIDDRPYKASLDKAKADLDVAKAALVKNQAFYDIGLSVQKQDKGAISEQQMEQRKGARDESVASVKQSQASLEMAQLNFDWCKVTAPISGRINQHFVGIGNLVSQDVTTLTNIVSLKPTWAYFDVDQNTVDRYQRLVKEGMVKSARASEIPVQLGLGPDKGYPVSGAIDFVSNQLDPNTGSIRVRAVFPNTEGTLVAGLFGRIRVPMTAPHEALLVTDRAIGTNQGQRYVLVVNDKSEVDYRAVDVGQVHDELREVLRFRTVLEPGADGKDVTRQVEVLTPTDQVIVEGLLRVRPGAKVEPKLVDMLTLLSATRPGPGPGAEKKSTTTAK